MLLKSEVVRFVDGNIIEKKDKSGLVAIMNIQKTLGNGEKEFKKIEQSFINNPSNEVIEFIKNAEMGDNFTMEINLK